MEDILFFYKREPVVQWWVGNELMNAIAAIPLLLPAFFRAVEAESAYLSSRSCVFVYEKIYLYALLRSLPGS